MTFNGEIYNYIELRERYRDRWTFNSSTDTETILAAYAREGLDFVHALRGMFGFALWDARAQRLVCARDRFGIKPFYYTVVGDRLYFASEAKALVPFLPSVDVDPQALSEYVVFQIPLTDATLFKGIRQLAPGSMLIVENGQLRIQRYWRAQFCQDHAITPSRARDLVDAAFSQAIDFHLRADVPIGAYLSGGLDSSVIALAARSQRPDQDFFAFHGKFTSEPGYDESAFAMDAAKAGGITLEQVDITASDFIDTFPNVIRALDYPVAGPGSFPQYMVSQLAARRLKVVLGGQGGDEVFGGYARYLIGYLDQALTAAIEGRVAPKRLPISLGELAPNLGQLAEYKPLLASFQSTGAFGDVGARYRQLIDRSSDMGGVIAWDAVSPHLAHAAYEDAFDPSSACPDGDVFNAMTRFDLERLLPALLHVEDRMSMVHGLESRVPLLDHPLVELVGSIPTSVKFAGGRLKSLLRESAVAHAPATIVNRRDKMGFPVPLKEWTGGPLKAYFNDLFRSRRARERVYLDAHGVRNELDGGAQFSRRLWALASLEMWHQSFVDHPRPFSAH